MDAPFTNLMDGIYVWAFAQLLNHAQGVSDFPYSSFHAYVRKGIYPVHWACEFEQEMGVGGDVIDAVHASPHPTVLNECLILCLTIKHYL